jgi:o-succinylbenzoate---CoA ligase
VPLPKPAALHETASPYPGAVTQGPAARTLTRVLTSGDETVLELLPALRAALSGSGPALRLYGPGDLSGPDGPQEVQLTSQDDDPTDPTAVAVTTSGSSGRAKIVLLSASALFASAGATHDRLGGAGHWLLALPAQHIAGVQVLVRSLIAGTQPAVLDLTTGFTPDGFTAAANRVGGRGPVARRYTALVPTQLSRLLTAPGESGVRAVEALRRFDAILVGGAATTDHLREQAAAVGVHLVSTYGMSETCGGCVYDGIPLDGVSVRIDGPAGDGEPGRVLLGGPTLARGYLQDEGRPPSPSEPFSTDEIGERWFRTDDEGTLQAGRLRVLGRLDSVIISGGVNIAPGPVEATLQRLPGVAEAVVVGLPDPEWGERVAAALVLVPGAAPPTLAQLRALVTAEVSAAAAPRQLTLLDVLPLRGPGKPDRAAIEKSLREQAPLEGL